MMMRRRKVLVVLALFLILLGLVGLVLGFGLKKDVNETDDADIAAEEDLLNMDVIRDTSTVDIEAVKIHNKADDCWVVFSNSVYDITDRLVDFPSIRESQCGGVVGSDLPEDEVNKLTPYVIAGFKGESNE